MSCFSTFYLKSTLTLEYALGEVQLLIDGHLAGVYWPFSIIFTGGIVPGLWRPVRHLSGLSLPVWGCFLSDETCCRGKLSHFGIQPPILLPRRALLFIFQLQVGMLTPKCAKIVGIDSFDLRQHEIDITPFLA